MNGTDKTPESSDSYFSLPPWPTVRLGRIIPLLLSVVIVVYSVGGILDYSLDDGLGMLLIAVFGFLGIGAGTMFTGFILRAFDVTRVLGTYFVGFGAWLGVIGALNFLAITII